MARYSINQLNYIASGEDRTLLNMDVLPDKSNFIEYIHLLAIEPPRNTDDSPLSHDILLEQGKGEFIPTEYIQTISSFNDNPYSILSGLSREEIETGIILNEQQKYFHETDGENRQYVRLYLSCCSETYRRKLIDFINNNVKNGHTYVIEHDQIDGDKNTIEWNDRTVEGIYDIDDVCMKSRNPSTQRVVDDFDMDSPTKTEDYYIPSDVGVMSFCQQDNTTYLITEQTDRQTEYVYLKDETEDGQRSTQYSMTQHDEKLKTVLYNTDEPLSSKSPSDAFSDIRTFSDVKYNYMVDIPMRQIKGANHRTDYDNGNIYCDILNTKNMYDSQYSMNMDSEGNLRKCRDYQEINRCGDMIYLKYDDVQNYNMDNGEISTLNHTYPKIETRYKIVNRTSNNHKTYFFSVNINDLDLNSGDISASDDSKSTEELKRNMSRDIKSAVKDIISHVCPVQTQLFDVYFNGNQET